MILLLRFIGVVNAAIWFGAAIFFSFVVAPAFFTPDLKSALGEMYTGLVAQTVLARFFLLNYVCGAVAIVHLLAEWVYLGRPLHRVTCGVLGGVFALGLLGGIWLQPKLRKLQEVRHGYTRTDRGYARVDTASPGQKAQAASSFRVWHGVASAMNLVVLGGVAFYFWRVTNPSDSPRYLTAVKFRG